MIYLERKTVIEKLAKEKQTLYYADEIGFYFSKTERVNPFDVLWMYAGDMLYTIPAIHSWPLLKSYIATTKLIDICKNTNTENDQKTDITTITNEHQEMINRAPNEEQSKNNETINNKILYNKIQQINKLCNLILQSSWEQTKLLENKLYCLRNKCNGIWENGKTPKHSPECDVTKLENDLKNEIIQLVSDWQK